MKPWEVLGRTRTPDGTELTLVRHPSEHAILVDGQRLMSSRVHASEDALSTLGCDRARTLAEPCVLVGGLGLGYTLRAALDLLPPAAVVVVAEFVSEVVEWNRGPLAPLAGRPLEDARVRIEIGDVGAVIRARPGGFDAILLDVDNGPEATTDVSNAGLYSARGIAQARAALRPGGVLAVWSTHDDRHYERRLREAGFRVQREHVRARGKLGGSRHTIFLGYLDTPAQ